MDPNSHLRLNFGGAGGYNNDRNYAATDGRVFPTTPSTFPQPVFPSQGGQPSNDFLGAGPPSGGYFITSPYQPQFSHQQPNQYQQSNVAAPQGAYQQRPGGFNANDPTSGLARQFSNQNLGSSQRQGNPFGRQPSPSSQRPRTTGGGGGQPYGNHLSPPIGGAGGRSENEEDERPPEKNAEKYSTNITKRGQGLHVLVEAFFKENISRARDRNIRYVRLNTTNEARDKKLD